MDLLGSPNIDWKNVACELLKAPKNWSDKEKWLLQVLAKPPSEKWLPPETLAQLSPLLHLKFVNGTTDLIKLYTTMGEMPHNEANEDIWRQIGEVKLGEARKYFAQASRQLNDKLEKANKQLSYKYDLIPDALISHETEGVSLLASSQTFGHGRSHIEDNQTPPIFTLSGRYLNGGREPYHLGEQKAAFLRAQTTMHGA